MPQVSEAWGRTRGAQGALKGRLLWRLKDRLVGGVVWLKSLLEIAELPGQVM
jgi:hypothetical protein